MFVTEERNRKLEVTVSMTEEDVDANTGMPCLLSDGPTANESEELMCTQEAYGKYIKIQQNNINQPLPLTFCEVQLLTP